MQGHNQSMPYAAFGGGLTRVAYHNKKVKRLKWVIAHFQKATVILPVICLSKNAAVSVKM